MQTKPVMVAFLLVSSTASEVERVWRLLQRVAIARSRDGETCVPDTREMKILMKCCKFNNHIILLYIFTQT